MQYHTVCPESSPVQAFGNSEGRSSPGAEQLESDGTAGCEHSTVDVVKCDDNDCMCIVQIIMHNNYEVA